MTEGTDPQRLDAQLCFALYQAARAMTRAYTPLLAPFGLTYPQYLVLLALWERDGLSVKELGAKLTLDSATLTPVLKRLEQQGLVARNRDRSDERVVRIALTGPGRALKRKLRGVPAALACRLEASAEPGDGARLLRLRDELNELACQLDKAG